MAIAKPNNEADSIGV